MEMDLTLDHQVSYFYTSHSSSQAEKTSESSLMPNPFQVMVIFIVSVDNNAAYGVSNLHEDTSGNHCKR